MNILSVSCVGYNIHCMKKINDILGVPDSVLSDIEKWAKLNRTDSILNHDKHYTAVPFTFWNSSVSAEQLVLGLTYNFGCTLECKGDKVIQNAELIEYKPPNSSEVIFQCI